jgi:hypothetical protein
METALIIAATALTGYYLKSTSEGIRNTNEIVDDIPTEPTKMQATDIPVSSNIYNSNMYEDANNEELKRSLKHYADSKDVSLTGALPPIYNSYGAIGNANFNSNSSNVSEINNINRLSNVSNTTKPPVLEDRPMFKPLTSFIGTEIQDNNFSNFGQSVSNVNVSLLTGQPLSNEHANMTPFFGSNVKQNVETFTNTSLLDNYSGNTSTFIHKKELPKFFESYKEDIHGTPLITDSIDTDRYIPSAFRQGEKPFYEERVAAPVGFTVTNPVTDASVSNKTIDQLRVGTKPQISYEARLAGFKPQNTNLQTSSAPVDKNRPDTSFEWGHSRLFTGPAQVVASQAPEDYTTNFQSTSRQDQNIEWTGPSKTQNADKTTPRLSRSQYDNSDELLVNFQEPKNQQFENQYQRNIGNTNLNNNLDDFNINGFNPQFQQRETTSKMHSINANKSGSGQQVYAQDKTRNTIKQTTLKFDNSGNIKNQNLLKGDTEIYEVGGLNVRPKTTNKETTVKNKYKGQINKKDGMGYNIANYEAKTTNKETTVKNNYNGHIADNNKSPMDYTVFNDPIKVRNPARVKNYMGTSKSYTPENENRDKYNNAQINEIKEKLLYSRPSNKASGSGSLGIINNNDIGEIKSTNNMLLKEGHYDITQIGNTSSNIPSKINIGQTDTLKLNLNSEVESSRFIGDIIENSLQNNPYYNLK